MRENLRVPTWLGEGRSAGPGWWGESRLRGPFPGPALMCPPTGLYGPEGILPARRTLRPQGKGRWQQLWETPTLLWEAPLLGLDTAQGLELLSLLGTVLALGALLTRPLRHPLVYLLLWAAYLSVCQASEAVPLGTLASSFLQAHPPSPQPKLPDHPSPCRWARCFFISSGE